MVACLAMVVTGPIAAQTPIPTTTPTPTPPEEVYRSEARIGVTSMSLQRFSAIDGAGTATGAMTLTGLELFARAENIGIYARTISGTSTASGQGLAGHFALREVRLILGDRTFSPEVGIMRRTTSTDADSERTIYRAGLRSQWEIGGSGVQVTLSGGVYLSKVAESGGSSFKVTGLAGEATLLYQAPRGLPLYALAGWRYERFDDYAGGPERSEANSGPFFGIGLRLGGRPVLR